MDEFDDATLVLFGHGSTVNPDTAAPVLRHAQELARGRIFAEVRPAIWKHHEYGAHVWLPEVDPGSLSVSHRI